VCNTVSDSWVCNETAVSFSGDRRDRRAAGQGGRDLRKRDVLAHNRVAAPRSAASVHGVGHEGDCVVAAVARYNTIETASAGSKALQNGR
jgi:ketosteroid isomerase-like protein